MHLKESIAGYRKETLLELIHVHLRRFFTWKRSVRISYFWRKPRVESKHSFSDQGKIKLALSIYNIVMVLKGKMFILTLNPLISENHEKLKQYFLYLPF